MTLLAHTFHLDANHGWIADWHVTSHIYAVEFTDFRLRKSSEEISAD